MSIIYQDELGAIEIYSNTLAKPDCTRLPFNRTFNDCQIAEFERFCKLLEAAGIGALTGHSSNNQADNYYFVDFSLSWYYRGKLTWNEGNHA